MNTDMIRKILEHQKIHQLGTDVRLRGYIQDRNNQAVRELCWKCGSTILDLHDWLQDALREIDHLRSLLQQHGAADGDGAGR